MMAIEAENRYFCSHLVSVQLPAEGREEREIVGNIEEISTSGACLNVEEPMAVGIPLRLVCSDRGRTCEFPGKVLDCLHDSSTGYYVEVEFDPGHRWSPEVFAPKHLIRADALQSTGVEGPSRSESCCERGVCPKAVISRVLEPEFPLTDRVRAVGQEVAALCGDLTETDAVTCFGSLFGAGPECSLFAQFLEAYAQGREKGPIPPHMDLRDRIEVLVQIAGAAATDAAGIDVWETPAPLIMPVGVGVEHNRQPGRASGLRIVGPKLIPMKI